MSYAIYWHCASGFTEIEDVVKTLDAAKDKGVKALADHPVTDCGTGGVVWVEVMGTDVPEPPTPSTSYDENPQAWDPYFAWEKTNIQIALSREDNGEWVAA